MAKGYWIARVDVHDLEAYKKYVAGNAVALNKYGGQFLTRGGQYENPEGSSRSRNVVIAFPSYQDALDCYHSSEYQDVIVYRQKEGVAESDLVIVEGYDG